MSLLSEAVELVRQQARTFGAVQAVAAVIDHIGDLETRLAELVKSHADVQQAHTDVQQQHAAARAELADTVAERETAGTAALEQARVDAAAIVGKATAEAQAAKSEAERQWAAADDMIAAKGAELKDIVAKIDAANVALAYLDTKIASANETIRKMLGVAP